MGDEHRQQSRRDDVVVVTIAHGRHQHLLRQRQLLQGLHPGVHQVVVAMADDEIADLLAGQDVTVVQQASTDDGLPLAAARNTGMRTAAARHPELVVLLDVDCVLGAGAINAYLAAAQQVPNGLLSGPVTYLKPGVVPPLEPAALSALRDPHPARPAPTAGIVIRDGEHRLFWSLNFAVAPSVWDSLGGFCERYTGYGGEDTDFAWTAREHGVELVWVGGADAYHQHHPVSSPPVEHTADIVRNAAIFHDRWGEWPMQGWLDALTKLGHIRWQSGVPQVAQLP